MANTISQEREGGGGVGAGGVMDAVRVRGLRVLGDGAFGDDSGVAVPRERLRVGSVGMMEGR